MERLLSPVQRDLNYLLRRLAFAWGSAALATLLLAAIGASNTDDCNFPDSCGFLPAVVLFFGLAFVILMALPVSLIAAFVFVSKSPHRDYALFFIGVFWAGMLGFSAYLVA